MSVKTSTKSAVTWFEALNEQAYWTSTDKFVTWLSGVLGTAVQPKQAASTKFNETLRRIRLQVTNMHFGLPVDSSWINQELKDSRPGLYTASAHSRLPAFRVEAQSEDADKMLEALRQTLLLQFAVFAGTTLSDDDPALRVERCRGLYRDDVPMPDAAVLPATVEKQWRHEIEVLQETGESAEDVLRCGDFFLKTPKARFCSDKCRFSTFQIMKQLQEPDYLAQKQKRYRDRSR